MNPTPLRGALAAILLHAGYRQVVGQAARHLGLLCSLQGSHRTLSAGVRGYQPGEGALSLCRAERQPQVFARSTHSLRSYQAHRAPQSEAGPFASGSGKEEAIESAQRASHATSGTPACDDDRRTWPGPGVNDFECAGANAEAARIAGEFL